MNADDLWCPDVCGTPVGNALFLSRRDGDRLIIAVVGELDVANARAAGKRIDETIVAEGLPHVVIDLAGVEFCDLAGLRALMKVHQGAADRAVTCRFVRSSRAILWLLHFSGCPAQPFASREEC